MLDNVLPIWWVFKTAQVRLKLAGKNLERGRLSDTVGTNKSKNLARSWHRQAMKLEAVGRIAMGDLRLQVGWQVDNVDGAEWTLLRADTTSDAEGLGNESDLGGWVDLNTEATTSDDWTGLLAFLSTFLPTVLALI